MTRQAQTGILAELPSLSRYLTFRLVPQAGAADLAKALESLVLNSDDVLGLGAAAVRALGAEVPGLHEFPELRGEGVEMPATPGDLWCWLRAEDRGELLHRGRAIARQLQGAFELQEVTDGFRYGSGLDLTGYEDGTENPTGEEAARVALVADATPGLLGSSFVAVQKWRHDLSAFEALSPEGQDHVIGRRISDNEELEDAPESAHVKRTAQEDFEPEAFVVRRSMPWAEGLAEGLVFVAFAASSEPFEALARRMLGQDDGITDALFGISSATTGNHYWCPPRADGGLDLRALKRGGS